MREKMKSDTICAISTPIGVGGVSIIRLSGACSKDIIGRIFDKAFLLEQKPRELILGEIKFNDFCDQALCVYFPNPNSFTGEDVVEINLHGGYYLTKAVLDEILKFKDIRLAEPGEFSKRAVLNGKMDITQAEGIIDIINATSRAELRASSNIINGGLSNRVNAILDDLTNLIAEVDVAIDYPDQDIEYISHNQILQALEPIQTDITNLLKTSATGALIKNGVTVALAGVPNAGKSSLLNALLGYDRAIVTDVAGTTRDTLSESYEYNGVRFNIVDTAGIRNSDDIVERAGIERAQNTVNEADLVIQLIDATRPLDAQDININSTINKIIVLNKIDAPNNLYKDSKYKNFDISISAINKTKIDELKQLIFDKTINSQILNEQILITNTRHKQSLEKSLEIIEQIKQALVANHSIDCLALLLRDCWLALASIIGENTDGKILDTIFSKFCLGK